MKLDFIDNGKEFDFGKISEDYAEFRNIYPRGMYEKLGGFGIGRSGQKILDLGSGTAVLPINMSRTGAEFTAADISENQINRGKILAKEKGVNNIAFKVCPAEDTGFPEDSFDVVTAVQCFHYFDADKAAAEINRVLKPNGIFCKIFMDWLPFEDEKIFEMEKLVLKYNPDWSGYGFKEYNYTFPKWAKNRFEIENVCSYNETLEFSKEAWLGRIKSCRGIGASLSADKIARFEEEYRGILNKYDEPLRLKHQIHIEVYKNTK
ncbi:MAG: class I SAM-dependent methyltransferase [Ruminococcus sp.]|nr:class I SAM-dependent methyltransferase [Ruminococcus sp.]